MNLKRKFWSGNNRFRLMLTLDLAVMLPAAALIYVNFAHLKAVRRDKVLEAAFHRDFQEMLAISEKKINRKIYTMTEEVRDLFPSPDTGTESDKGRRLDLILSKSPWVSHVFLFDHEKGLLFRSQPQQMSDRYFCEEHERLAEMFGGWLGMEAKMMVEGMHKRNRLITFYPDQVKRAGSYSYMTTAFFCLQQLSKDRAVLGGVSFDPNYLKQTFFPEMLEELIAHKLTEGGGNQLIRHPLGNRAHRNSRRHFTGSLAAHSVRHDVKPYLRLHRFVILRQIQRKHAVLVQLTNQTHVGEMS